MSDTSQGIGWWQASDHKWYPPDLYPKDWQAADAADALVDGPADGAVDRVAEDSAAAVEQPTVMAPIVEPEPAPAPTPTPTESLEPVFERLAPQAAVADTPIAAGHDTDWYMPSAGAPVSGETTADSPASEPASVIDWTEPSAAQTTAGPAPTGWQPSPDPAVHEPTLVEGIAPIAVDATQVQPALAPPRSGQTPPQAPPATWDHASPSAPEASATTRPSATPGPTGADVPAGVLGVLGAAALIGGSFLAWAKAGGTLTSGTVNGLTGSNGWGTLICGLIIVGVAAALLVGQRRSWVGGALVLTAVVAVGLAVFSILDINSTSDDLSGVLRSEGVAGDVADGAVLDLDVGLWIVTAGGAVAAIAGVLALIRRDDSKT